MGLFFEAFPDIRLVLVYYDIIEAHVRQSFCFITTTYTNVTEREEVAFDRNCRICSESRSDTSIHHK
jgi:hypothetical protein